MWGWGKNEVENSKASIFWLHLTHLSGLALLCSGPMPSMPWGSSITSPLCRTHFAWPELMNCSRTLLVFRTTKNIYVSKCFPIFTSIYTIDYRAFSLLVLGTPTSKALRVFPKQSNSKFNQFSDLASQFHIYPPWLVLVGTFNKEMAHK